MIWPLVSWTLYNGIQTYAIDFVKVMFEDNAKFVR
jgi:hypothetical protein